MCRGDHQWRSSAPSGGRSNALLGGFSCLRELPNPVDKQRLIAPVDPAQAVAVKTSKNGARRLGSLLK